MDVVFNSEVVWLLIGGTQKKVRMKYINESWLMPVIGRRPPFYTSPRYDPFYSRI
ncbi:hypothetical protein [Virgibacillus proomii]|uniref:hypothetical protein n=1 Tax=Virgibacillus proomii TaxID=84407 RepID=UPI0015C2CF44|nr:hypothetical protein [Virgibacillus proomii]